MLSICMQISYTIFEKTTARDYMRHDYVLLKFILKNNRDLFTLLFNRHVLIQEKITKANS